MRRLRRIKILATLGPVSSDSAMIRKLFEAGADVFRINMSHTSHDKMRELVKTIRNVESSYGRPIGILVDLQGPKLRLGAFVERAQAQLRSLQIDQDADRPAVAALDIADGRDQFAHLVMRGVAHIDAEHIGAGLEQPADHRKVGRCGAKGGEDLDTAEASHGFGAVG